MSIIQGNARRIEPPPSGGPLSSIGEMSSLRFTGTASLIKRMDQDSNASKFTHSTWLKLTGKGQQGNDYINFFNASQNYPFYSEYAGMIFRESGSLCVYQFDNQSSRPQLNGNYSADAAPFFRDYSAWYHVVTTYDADAGYVKQYVNGEEVASYSYSTAAYCLLMNSSEGREVWHSIGGYWHNPGTSWAHKNHYLGYMADIYLIDGTALAPTAFGEEISGVWVPKAYDPATSGAYGTNGFHLDFAPENRVYGGDGKLTKVLDASGENNNDWDVRE